MHLAEMATVARVSPWILERKVQASAFQL